MNRLEQNCSVSIFWYCETINQKWKLRIWNANSKMKFESQLPMKQST